VLPNADVYEPVAFLAAHNKILIGRGQQKPNREDEAGPFPRRNSARAEATVTEYYLLDAASGTVQAVKGEFRPLRQQTFRPLQATGAPDEFWAAIYDEKAKETAIGRYHAKSFVFTAADRLPGIRLDSMEVVVEEKASKIYFVYGGHLLGAPLTGQ
jgi:hypothetical protein